MIFPFRGIRDGGCYEIKFEFIPAFLKGSQAVFNMQKH